jgi:hypothetical protein
MVPASEQSGSSFFDEYRFLTNWDNTEHDDWTLPAIKDPHDWCGLWRTDGCLNASEHSRLGYGNVVFVRQYQRSCFRPVCRLCYEKWIGRQANRATRRIEKFQNQSGRQSIHIFLSVSQWDWNLPFDQMRKKARKIIKEIGIIGAAVIFHPFRFNKKIRCWYYSPHFHIVGFGQVSGIVNSYYKNYWYIGYVGVRKSVFHTFWYLLSHCGIKKGYHALAWVGDLSYSKLKLEKERESSTCPYCNGKFVQIYYAGLDPVVPPPEQFFEGLVDATDWLPVETEYEYDLCKFEYASERSLNDLLKGITEAI